MIDIIPAIDLIDGEVVRLTQGDYNLVTKYAKSPVDLAKQFEDFGAPRLHLVDLDGAKKGHPVNLKTLESIRNSISIPIEVGGGIRSLETAKQLKDIGIDFLILGSLLIKEPENARSIIEAYPHQVIAGIDAKGDHVAIHGWLEKAEFTIQTTLEKFRALPIASVIFTDISKDGMLTGPNIEKLVEVCTFSPFPVIASGGVGNLNDLKQLNAIHHPKLQGCIVGKAILSGHISLDLLWQNTFSA